MEWTKNQQSAHSGLFFWKVLSYSIASGSLTWDTNLKWSLMQVLSSDSSRMSKYERKKQRSSVLDLRSLLKSLALYIRKWVVLFILNFLTFYSSPVLWKWPSARSLQPFPLLSGLVTREGLPLASEGCEWMLWLGAPSCQTVSFLCLHKAQLPVMAGSMWYLVLGLLFRTGTLDNIRFSPRHTCEWVSWLPIRHGSSSDITWAWSGGNRLKLQYFKHTNCTAVKNSID